MAMEPTPRFNQKKITPKRKPGFPLPMPKQQAPVPMDRFGGINRGDKGDSDRNSSRSHRDC